MYVMYNWSLWSESVMRTERAKIMDLPRDLRLVAYLCRLKFAWQMFLRIDSENDRLVVPVLMRHIPVEDECPTWELGRRDAAWEIHSWLRQNGDGVPVRDLALKVQVGVTGKLACQSC